MVRPLLDRILCFSACWTSDLVESLVEQYLHGTSPDFEIVNTERASFLFPFIYYSKEYWVTIFIGLTSDVNTNKRFIYFYNILYLKMILLVGTK